MTMYDVGNAGPQTFPFKHRRDKRGNCSGTMEDLWDGVRTWAAKHGYNYIPSYGIEGVGAT